MGRCRLSCSPDRWCSLAAGCLQEVLDFQVDKQARLNQLPATVSLRRHQLAVGEWTAWSGLGGAAAAGAAGLNALGVVGGSNGASGATQEELSEALVFSSHALERLKLRMEVCVPPQGSLGVSAGSSSSASKALPY